MGQRFFKYLPTRLGYLAQYVEPVTNSASVDELRSYFEQDATMIAIPIEVDGGVVGFVARDTIIRNDLKQGIFKSPKVQDAIESKPTIRDAMESIYQTLGDFGDNAASTIFLVYHRGRYIGLSSVYQLLMHSTKLQAADLEQAKAVQEALIHIESPAKSLRLEWFNKMAHEVGGDFLQSRQMGNNSWFLGVFDMAGKGVSAALSTSLISSYFETLNLTGALTKISNAQVVGALHKLLRSTISDQGFLACAFLFADIEAQSIAIFNCGLGPIVAFSATAEKQTKTIIIDPNLPPLGFEAFPLDKMSCTNIKMTPGLKIFASTDGLTDMKGPDGESFSEDELKTFLSDKGHQDAAELKKSFTDFIIKFLGLAPQADDITFAIVECL